MKRLMKFVLVMAMVMMMCGGAMAQSEFIPKGSAIVPNITAERNTPSWTSSHINITNITNSSIQCKVTVYDHDGNETGDLNLYSGSATGVLHIGPIVAPFAIPAHGSRVVSFTVTENYYVQGHEIGRASCTERVLRLV